MQVKDAKRCWSSSWGLISNLYIWHGRLSEVERLEFMLLADDVFRFQQVWPAMRNARPNLRAEDELFAVDTALTLLERCKVHIPVLQAFNSVVESWELFRPPKAH